MIRKSTPSDLIRGGHRFSQKIVLHQNAGALNRFILNRLRSKRQAGFTLIEMQAVMVIIALIAALVFTILPGTGRAQLKAVALQTAALFRRERLGAILTGHNRSVSIDAARRALVGDGDDHVAIPRDVTVDILGVDEQWSGQQAVVRFLPDGASSGTVVKLTREGATYEIRVNWYTGGVLVEQE